jgi:pyruvate dehydrogenase E1 component
VRNVADQIRAFVPKTYMVLGTDGFGRSDTRKNLRRHFEVNSNYVALAAIKTLADEGELEAANVKDAIKKYNIDANKPNPIVS